YKPINKIEEGTFSEVTKMQNLRDGNYYALNNLQEVQALRRLNPHPNILTLHKVEKTPIIRGEKKITYYMNQLCKSLDHMHRNGIFHRDVKPEDILIKQDVLRLGDFRSCRSFYSKHPYMEYISTRWYRAPECLPTDGFHSYTMDLLQPLFPGANELVQISRIHDVMGTPAEAMSFDFPFKKGPGRPLLTTKLSPQCLSLLHGSEAEARGEASSAQGQAKGPPLFSPSAPIAPELLSNTWQAAPEGRKQKQQGPAHLMELPRPKLSGAAKPSSYSSPALQSVFATDTQKDIKPSLKEYRLPTTERSGGGC
ncbi:hypothetical protein FD755_015597, partial [Muntiacus reevesi]